MRVLFISDLQLEAGAPLGNGAEYGEGSRFAEQETMLSAVVECAVHNQAQLVCVLGDVFEFRKPSPWAVIAFQNFIHALRDAGKEVLILQGNHDVKSPTLPTALGIFDEQVELALVPSLYPIGDTVFATLPWAPIGNLVAKHTGSRGELNTLAAAGLVHAAQFLGLRCREEYPGMKSVLLGHWAVSGAALPSGLDIGTTAHEPIIPLDSLIESGFDLIAFGHVHKAQVLSENPPIFYCGSPMVCNWGETNIPHGVWNYDPDGPLLQFTELHDKPFFTLEASKEDGLVHLMHTVRGAAVRVRYTATQDEAKLFDHDAIRQALFADGAVKVLIQPTIVQAERARVAELDDTISPQEAMRMWLESQEIIEEQPILDAHTDYLEGL